MLPFRYTRACVCVCACVASAKRHVVASASIVFQHFIAAAAAILRHADGCIQLAAWHIDKVEPGLTTKSQRKWSSAYLSTKLRANMITSLIWRKDFILRNYQELLVLGLLSILCFGGHWSTTGGLVVLLFYDASFMIDSNMNAYTVLYNGDSWTTTNIIFIPEANEIISM